MLGHLMLVASKVSVVLYNSKTKTVCPKLAKQLNLARGFRLVINDGPNGCKYRE